MSNQIIKFNIVGKILEGDDKGQYIMIQTDFDKTGEYIIIISDDPNFNSDEQYDYWVEQYNNLLGFFEESKWKIQWL